MAKQVGPIFITGTIDGIIFYKLDGQYLMRSKGSYKSGKQMRKNPRFKRTIENADRFGEASSMVKSIYYRHIPRTVRRHGLYGHLSGRVNTWLYQGKSQEEAEALLIAYCKTLVQQAAGEAQTPPPAPVVAASTKQTQPPTSPNIKKPKQGRYLSNWKVKRNGRLHIPKSAYHLSLQPIVPSMAQPLKE